jgi:hypothetical protein
MKKILANLLVAGAMACVPLTAVGQDDDLFILGGRQSKALKNCLY